MTLDMLKVSPKVVQMGGDLAARYQDLGPRQAEARRILRAHASEWEALQGVAAASKRRLASPREPLDMRRSVQEPPRDHVVIATDGSQIEPDRHGPADYFLLNVGWAVVRYGSNPFAELAAEPELYFGPEQTYITFDDRRVPIQDHLLSVKRAGKEIERAAELAEAWKDAGPPSAVLADGTLLQWVTEDRPVDFLRMELVTFYVEGLDRIHASGLPLASYVSRSRSTEVAGLLREAVCLSGRAACRACTVGGDELCVFERLTDRDLFGDLLPGERSGLFAMTLPNGLATLYREHAPWFFYLNVGREIGRVEVPPWTAQDERRLDLVQAVVLDQCQKGLGYPNVLARAHEQAIVTGQDRMAFEYLVEAVLARAGVPARVSEKLHSKRIRAV